MFSGLAPYCTVPVMTTTRRLLKQKKIYSQGHPRVGNNDDEFAKTTYFDWRSHVSGISVWEVLQETTRTANSLDKVSYVEKHQQSTNLPSETGEFRSTG